MIKRYGHDEDSAGKRERISKGRALWLLIFFLISLGNVSMAYESREKGSVFKAPSLRWNGFTQVDYTYWEEGIDGFRIRRARVGLKGNILENISYKLQFETMKSPLLLDAQIGMDMIPAVKLIFGQFKVPFSLENLTSSSDLDTINRSQTVEKLCPGRDIKAKGRDIGLTVKAQFSAGECTFGIFNGSGINRADSDDTKDLAGRVVLSPFSFFTLGLSHYRGHYSYQPGDPSVSKKHTGLETSFVQGNLSVKGEYVFVKHESTKRCGWYIQGGYFLIAERVQALVKYDSLDINRDIRGDRVDIITLGMNWYFSKRTKFQINYEYSRGESGKNSKNLVAAQFQAGF